MADDRALQKQMQNDYKTMFEHPAGRRVLKRILFSLVDVRGSVFSTNALTMAHAEGRRSLGRAIALDLDVAVPGAYASLMSEVTKEVLNAN